MQTSPYMRRQIPSALARIPLSRVGPGLTSKTGLGLEREHELRLKGSWVRRPAGARGLRTAPGAPLDGSERVPRGLQTAPRAFQEAPRGLQEASRRPRALQEASRRLQEHFKRVSEASGGLKTSPRALQEASQMIKLRNHKKKKRQDNTR